MSKDISDDSDDSNDNGPTYLPQSRIDFSQIYWTLRNLCLFDDVYLGMQGMNIAAVDGYITSSEYNLLREYIELERTPIDSCIFVSAVSQMWIFAVYELLRTWRQRIKKFIKWSDSGGLIPFIEKQANSRNPAARIQARQAKRLAEDPKYRVVMETHMALMESPFQLAEALRINLAKQEPPGKEKQIAVAPGYGRINMHCGSMDFQIQFRDGFDEIVNRRDLADCLRNVNLQCNGGMEEARDDYAN